MKKKFYCGIDGGTTWLGLAFRNPVSKEGVMMAININMHEGITFKYRNHDYHDVAQRIVEENEEYFKRTICIGVERLDMPANRKVLYFQSAFVQTIRFMYPEIKIIHIQQRNVRNKYNLSEGNHKGNKKKSYEFFKNLSTRTKLKKIYGKHADAIEAYIISIYLTEKYYIEQRPRPAPKKKTKDKRSIVTYYNEKSEELTTEIS